MKMSKGEIIEQIEDLVEELLDEVQLSQENDVRDLRRIVAELKHKLGA